MFDEKFSQLHDVQNPLDQFAQATELLSFNQQLGVEIARVRKQAIERAVNEYGMSYSAVAEAVGLTKGRIAQIKKSAPPEERRFFGYGPVNLVIPQRVQEGRQFSQVDYGDLQARKKLKDFLDSLAFETRQVEITENQPLDFFGDTVAICGPKNSSVVRELLQSDQRIHFAELSSGSWRIEDSAGEEITGTGDLGYIGRMPYENHQILIVAGLHVAGSIGAVDYLVTHLLELYKKVGTENFSMLIDSKMDDRGNFESSPICEAQLL